MDPSRRKGILLLLATSILWSVAGILIKLMSWTGPQVACARSLLAALVILCFIKRPSLKFTPARIGAIVCYAASVCLFVLANKLTTAAVAILIQYTAPIYAAILGRLLLKERVRGKDIISISVMLVGLVLFVFDGLGSGNLLGGLCCLGASVAFGAMSVFMRMERYNDPGQSVFWGNILCALIMLPFFGRPEITTVNIVSIAVLGIFQLGLSYVFYTKAIRYVTALEATMIPVLEPLLNPLWVALFYGELPGWLAIVGGVIVLLGVVGREFFPDKKPADPAGKEAVFPETLQAHK